MESLLDDAPLIHDPAESPAASIVLRYRLRIDQRSSASQILGLLGAWMAWNGEHK
jgi:hypothetical protein